MQNQITAIYCICHEVVRTCRIKDDPQCKMSTAEIMTFALISAITYGCDYRKTRLVSFHHRYFSKIVSHSQIVRRIHQIPECIWMLVFYSLQILLRNHDENYFIVDSFPVKAYENHKSFRARIFAGKEYHGYTASKKQYFFGIKVHMIVDINGIPIEFSFTPGSASDIKSLQQFSLNLSKGSVILADKAYSSYEFEDLLFNIEGIKLLPKRRCGLKRQNSSIENAILSNNRNKIETVFSSIIRRMPRYIRATTEKGFCLKVLFFLLAYMVNLYHPVS